MAGLEEAECQLSEIELLTSMFPGQEELVMVDQLALAELREYVEGTSQYPPSSRPEFIIHQKVGAVPFAISCTYVPSYPKVLPEIVVRCTKLTRAQLAELHKDLITHLGETCQGEMCVLTALEWVRDNAQRYISQSPSSATIPEDQAPGPPRVVFTRLWIYSHHIYNKNKRKNILEWAKELGLSGFSMPGKPGVVCVEGPQPACEDFWARVKCLTWKRIMIRHREDVLLDPQESLSSMCRFTGFEEAIFDPRGSRGNHMDLGQLYQFLSERGCGDVFQLYFGIEGR
ncbi:RWD domain-containing protein 2B-like [Scleropages formosus]|uniref:RWD domain containing 2B n=1 Tax=Scleropages formosus TaxID=113540 RepID=A0A0P7WV06_SCLFO|nr:RWD domain-containing protein 2B [Scleropages formosus]KPP67866.1 RWD domain-containing protein 2B-like [Scleropages formosus]